MSATFSQLTTISNNGDFQNRVAYSLLVAAVNVYSELSSTPGHIARSKFATTVVNGQFNIQPIALAVLTNSTIAAEANILTTPGFAIPDADIQFAVNSLWNALAGA
jgi:hypothetical protein